MKGRRRLMFVLVGAVAALALGSFAWAAIPDGGVVHGCYDKQSGALRVTDAATKTPKGCSTKEAALDWSQQGPQGPSGPQGAQGIQGIQGQQGPKGDPGASELDILTRPNAFQGLSPSSKTVGYIGPLQGKYLVNGKLVVTGGAVGVNVVTCSLYGGASLQDQATVGVKFGETATVSLIGSLDAGGYASVDCKSLYTDGTVYGKNLVIAATKVGDIYHSY